MLLVSLLTHRPRQTRTIPPIAAGQRRQFNRGGGENERSSGLSAGLGQFYSTGLENQGSLK